MFKYVYTIVSDVLCIYVYWYEINLNYIIMLIDKAFYICDRRDK
jgi:hypothetical protein